MIRKDKAMKQIVNLILMIGILSFIAGCAGMTPTEQRMLSGGAIGAAGGAVIGAATGGSPAVGAAIGGAAGVVGGAVVNQIHRGGY
jgi:hypothetical protein